MVRRRFRPTSQTLMVLGIGLFIGAIAWWYKTFGLDIDFIKCLVVDGGRCRISSIKGLFGGSQYSPMVFWAAMGCWGSGYVLKKMGK